MEHSFNIEFANQYGIEEAIIIKNMWFWIEKNKANEKHFYEGKYWTYNSAKAFLGLFPYMTHSKIRRAIENLVEKDILVKGNFNKSSYDRTYWYSFSDNFEYRKWNMQKAKMDSEEMANGIEQNDTPIPDSIPDSKLECTWKNPSHPLKEKILEKKMSPLLRLDPPTPQECDDLVAKFTSIGHDIQYAKKAVWNMVERMYNYNGIKKNKSFYLTCVNWINRDINDGKHIKKPKSSAHPALNANFY